MQAPPCSQRVVFSQHGGAGSAPSPHWRPTAHALVYYIGLEARRGDSKLRMMGNQLHQLAPNEHAVVPWAAAVRSPGGEVLSAAGTDDLPPFFHSLPSSGSLCTCSSPFSWDSPLSLAVIPPTINADLFCSETRCGQGQTSAAAHVTLWHKSGTETSLWPQWRDQFLTVTIRNSAEGD